MLKGNESVRFLGLEGGATRTVAILSDQQERLVQRLEAGPANLKLLTDKELVNHLAGVAKSLPDPWALCVGLAGLRTDKDRLRVLAAAAEAWPGKPCRACSDLEIALAAAPAAGTKAAARVLVLSGTGSSCYGRAGGRTSKVGGWGHLLGDQGSAYAIGLEALRELAARLDRTGAWPRLGEEILRALQLNHADDLIPWAQAAEKREVAALALTVFEAWGRQDALASGILSKAADALADDARACAQSLVRPGAVVQFIFAGGVLLKQPRFSTLVSSKLTALWPQAVITPLELEGAWGAVRMAKAEWRRTMGPQITGRATLLTEAAVNQPSRSRATTAQPTHDSARSFFIPESASLSPTEQRNPRSTLLHKVPLADAIALMLSEEGSVAGTLLAQKKQIERAIRMIVRAFRRNGRLIYAGAGTSGRLGALDASECPPTFRAPPDQVQGIIAGGREALWTSVEGAEDDAQSGADAIQFRGVNGNDVVVGIAASGRTPFVWGALDEAGRRGASTVLVCFNPWLKIPRERRTDCVLAFDLGPEVLTGSTRLKAGTATKLLLNLFTTLSMVRMGKVVSNLMVDVNPSNQKLRLRAIRIVRELTGVDEAESAEALIAADWIIKDALRQLRMTDSKDKGLAARHGVPTRVCD